MEEQGLEVFLAHERDQWSCRECGSPICVHDGVCSGCGKKYGKPIE